MVFGGRTSPADSERIIDRVDEGFQDGTHLRAPGLLGSSAAVDAVEALEQLAREKLVSADFNAASTRRAC
jgi:hypothetical protein